MVDFIHFCFPLVSSACHLFLAYLVGGGILQLFTIN